MDGNSWLDGQNLTTSGRRRRRRRRIHLAVQLTGQALTKCEVV
jgi:hypothetical protein